MWRCWGGWYEACRAGDLGALGGSYGAGYTLVERDVEELGELLGQRGNEGWAFGVMSVLWTEERAKAVSREIAVGEPKVGGPMVLVWTLEKGAGGWKIVDIDLEGVDGLQRENARFMDEHPGAQVWLAGKGGAEVPARMVGSWELISERREHRQAYLDIRGDGFGTVYELDKKEPGRVSGGVYRIRVESANRLVLSVWTIGCTEPGVTALSYAISGRRMTWRDAGDDLVMKWRKVNDAADQSGTKRVFVPLVSMPEADTVLDLASGEVLPWQAKGDGARANGVSALRACREAGKGDLVWWGQDLVVLRGGKVARYEAGREEALAAGREVEDTTGYRLPEAPCRLLVTTGEGRRYKVDVVAAGIDGLLVEYGLIEGREAREAVDRGVAG